MNVGEYSPIGVMVKNQKLSLFEQTKRIITPISTNVMNVIFMNIGWNFKGVMKYLRLF